jgi:Tol biopolymer transport system component
VYSPDGSWLVFREGTEEASDIHGLRVTDGSVEALKATEFQEWAFSPGGRSLAYVSNRTGRNTCSCAPSTPRCQRASPATQRAELARATGVRTAKTRDIIPQAS